MACYERLRRAFAGLMQIDIRTWNVEALARELHLSAYHTFTYLQDALNR